MVTRARTDDPPSVSMQVEGATLTLIFDSETEDAALLEIVIAPPADGSYDLGVLLGSRFSRHVQCARAALAHDQNDVGAALAALQRNNAPRRGLADDFLRVVGQAYTTLVSEGEPYPVKALAELRSVDKSTASRWVTAARKRGYLERLG